MAKQTMIPVNIKKSVREGYAKIAKRGGSCCRPVNSSCGCGGNSFAKDIGKKVGYSGEEMKAVPEGANLGLGCGNPTAFASLKGGEVVLDLGSGAGFDAFLTAKKVGKSGKVIGVDMTSEMIEKARENALKGDYENVEFRLGEIENLPVADGSVDVVISNCVINLAPDKKRVFKEAFRVLKPGGRLMISDIVLLKELPSQMKGSVEAYIGCVSGAVMKGKYLKMIEMAGFQEVDIVDEIPYPIEKAEAKELEEAAELITSIKVKAIKPK